MVIVDIFNLLNIRKKLNDLYLIFFIFDWKWELKILLVFFIMYIKKLSVNIFKYMVSKLLLLSIIKRIYIIFYISVFVVFFYLLYFDF